jgi:exopolyphosphatase/guanosine-5'-triphosphate,3'-diphosphate pyrophosphatase
MSEVAAVDLGSNSFHLLVARDNGGQLQIVDRLRDAVRLAAGLTADKRLQPAVQERALECLSRFGQRLRGLPPQRVRVVGTNTLRKLIDSGFVLEAEKAIGHAIEIISGVEEARLVYSGVTHGLPNNEQRLVIDIGGGSTELIIGKGGEPKLMESVSLGCVTHTQRFFADGHIDKARFAAARLAARVELEFLERRYRYAGWEVALGASGTVRGAWRVMRAQGWSQDLITREALEKTVALLIKTGRIEAIDFDGLREDRRPVFAGGLAVLAGVFDTLDLDVMHTSENALREGVIYDLLGRLSNHDVRESTVSALARRYGVEESHAQQIAHTAQKLLHASQWQQDPEEVRLLNWAARLHEVGLAIAHDGYHRHGEYILRHADLSGFSRTEQRWLAALVRCHRGKFDPDTFDGMHPNLLRLACLLRLAVLLHRAREPEAGIPWQLEAGRRNLHLSFRTGWLEQHPLTQADLVAEAEVLEGAGFRLKWNQS